MTKLIVNNQRLGENMVLLLLGDNTPGLGVGMPERLIWQTSGLHTDINMDDCERYSLIPKPVQSIFSQA